MPTGNRRSERQRSTLAQLPLVSGENTHSLNSTFPFAPAIELEPEFEYSEIEESPTISRFFVLETRATITHVRTNVEGIRFRLYSRWLESHARIDPPAVGQSPLAWNRTQITITLYNTAHLASSSSGSGSSLDWSLLARFSPVPEDGNLMLAIDDDQAGTILINGFQIESADQQPPLDDIEEDVESMGEVPGVVPFSLHRSLDGERVASYVQFESRDVFEAVRDSRDREEQMGDAMAAAEPDPHFLRGRAYTREVRLVFSM